MGVAGGGEVLKQGCRHSLRIATTRYMDAPPLFPRFEIPLSGKTKTSADEKSHHNCKELQSHISKRQIEKRAIKIKVGLIASGDQFISNQQVLNKLKDDLPGLMAVEMEGAAIASGL